METDARFIIVSLSQAGCFRPRTVRRLFDHRLTIIVMITLSYFTNVGADVKFQLETCVKLVITAC